MITFTREVVVNREYTCTLEDFMKGYYAGADIDNDHPDTVLIYVNNIQNMNCMSYVFNVPYIEGKDINEDEDVEFMIRKHFKENNNEI